MPANISSVPLRRLGKNGPLVPAMGFGLMGMGYQNYGTVPSDDERFALLDRAVELGSTFWDTSDLYGDSEELIGKWFQRTGKRDQVFLATKFGYVKGDINQLDSSFEYTKKACEESLARLGVDSIDLYYVHQANPDTPIEETMRALVELQREGKINHIGLSTVSSTTLRRAVKVGPVAAVQTMYSVFDRDIEGPEGTHLLATCRELGVALVAATPLGRGILTNRFSKGEAVFDGPDMRPGALPQFHEANLQHNVETARRFASLAESKGCTVAQLALAWLLKQGPDIVPIPGTKKMAYLEENWAALDVALSEEEEDKIREFSDSHRLAGPSVPDGFKSHVYRDTKEECR